MLTAFIVNARACLLFAASIALLAVASFSHSLAVEEEYSDEHPTVLLKQDFVGRFATGNEKRIGPSTPIKRIPALNSDGHSASMPSNDIEVSRAHFVETTRRSDGFLESQKTPPQPVEIGYDHGFYLADSSPACHAADDMSFLMRLNSWSQIRHTVFDSDGPNLDENDIEFERLRLVVQGHIYTPDLQYFLQIDGDSDQSETADWLDYFIRFDVGRHLLGWEKGRFGIRTGKWKMPYNRARQESGWKLQFADRSMASSFFDINRSLGFAFFGRVDAMWTAVHWEAALFNGFRTGGFQPGRRGELDRNFAVAARISSDVAGQWGDDGEADLNFHKTPAVRVGSGIALTRVDNVDGPREFSRQRVVDSGTSLSDLLPPSVDAYDIGFFALDANLKFRGFSLHSEYYARHISDYTGAAVPDLTDHGFLLQTGYLVVHNKLELISRWSRIVGNSGSLGVTNQSADELAFGTVWYIRGQSIKATFDATHLNGAPIRSSALNILPGDDGWLYRTQMQIRF